MRNFMTLKEIVEDELFIENVELVLAKLCVEKNTRPACKLGYQYLRDWYDRMQPEGNINAAYFIANIELIWEKKSKLPRQVRHIIQYVCDVAFNKILNAREDVIEHVGPVENVTE